MNPGTSAAARSPPGADEYISVDQVTLSDSAAPAASYTPSQGGAAVARPSEPRASAPTQPSPPPYRDVADVPPQPAPTPVAPVAMAVPTAAVAGGESLEAFSARLLKVPWPRCPLTAQTLPVDEDGLIDGKNVRGVLMTSELDVAVLGAIWMEVDQDHLGKVCRVWVVTCRVSVW